jgi:hypothetical protein
MLDEGGDGCEGNALKPIQKEAASGSSGSIEFDKIASVVRSIHHRSFASANSRSRAKKTSLHRVDKTRGKQQQVRAK